MERPFPTKSVAPEASVVIPWCGEQTLSRCVGLLGQSPLFEILVVDNRPPGSATPDIEHARVIVEHTPGAAAARNRGIEEAQGRYILFIDADCLPDEDWACKMLRQLKETGADAVQGPVLSRQRERVARFIQAEFDQRQARLKQNRDIALVSTGNAGFRKVVLREVGGFDLAVKRVEDTDLSFRLKQRGFRLRYVCGPVVWHAHPTRMWVLLRRKFWYGYWLSHVYLRYPRRIVENTRTPRVQLISMALWWVWVPAVVVGGWSAWVTVPLVQMGLAVPLVQKSGFIAIVLGPLGTLMNTLGVTAGLIRLNRLVRLLRPFKSL